jgi:hypothetical protein
MPKNKKPSGKAKPASTPASKKSGKASGKKR